MEPRHKSPWFQCLLVSKQLLPCRGTESPTKIVTGCPAHLIFCFFELVTEPGLIFSSIQNFEYLTSFVPLQQTPDHCIKAIQRTLCSCLDQWANVPQSFPFVLYLDVTLRWIPKATGTFPTDPLRAGRQAENRVTNHRAPNKWHQHSLEMDCVFHPRAACGTCVPFYTNFHWRICPILWPVPVLYSESVDQRTCFYLKTAVQN